MTRVGIIKQVYGSHSYIYAIADTMNQAENIAKRAWRNTVEKNSHYYVKTISDNALIGDDI